MATFLMYHSVFPAKYRRAVFDERIDKILKETRMELEKRYEVKFLKIGTDEHVHFWFGQCRPTGLTKMIQNLAAKKVFPSLSKCKKATMEKGILEWRLFCFNCRKTR